MPSSPDANQVQGRQNTLAKGTYHVLATLRVRNQTYRVFAELCVEDRESFLRIYPFDAAKSGDRTTERRLTISITNPEIEPLKHKTQGADFVLCTPVKLSGEESTMFFGSEGPPVI